jgi:hypothetical protein
MSDFETSRPYLKRTAQLRRQYAGMELVLHIRSVIDSEDMRRMLKGDCNDNLLLHIRRNPVSVEEGYRFRELRRVIDGKTLEEQKLLLEAILRPYADAGDMPPFHISEATFKGDSEPHAVIKYDFVM